MRTLDLNAMGVVEMEVMETKEVNGGGWGEFILGMAKDIITTWSGLCDEMETWMKAHPDEVQYYRILRQ